MFVKGSGWETENVNKGINALFQLRVALKNQHIQLRCLSAGDSSYLASGRDRLYCVGDDVHKRRREKQRSYRDV